MDEHMDLRRLRGLMAAWKQAPPVHVSARSLLGGPGGSSQNQPEDDGGVESLFDSLPTVPRQTTAMRGA